MLSLLHVLGGYVDSNPLGVPRRRYDTSTFPHSVLERWDSFELGDGKLKGVRDKPTSNRQLTRRASYTHVLIKLEEAADSEGKPLAPPPRHDK